MVKIKIWGNISPKTSYIVEQAIYDLESETEPIVVLLNSEGGFLADTVAIINLLKSVPNPIYTIALGNCISAAAMLFSIGQKRYVGDDLCYMIHQPYLPQVIGNINHSKLTKKIGLLKKDLDLYLKYVTSNGACIPDDKLNEVKSLGNDLFLTSNECIKYKIATNKFKSWKDFFKREKIDKKDQTSSYDSYDDSLTEEVDEIEEGE